MAYAQPTNARHRLFFAQLWPDPKWTLFVYFGVAVYVTESWRENL